MSAKGSTKSYGVFLLLVAGMGGLLYGIDVGIVSAALLWLGKTVSLTNAQTSLLVAAVFGGSTAASVVAGFCADKLGRKTMMVVSGAMFVASVLLIVSSHGFTTLFAGRLLQGMSGGVIAVVVPLYLSESLDAATRGRGAGVFQLMLTIGIVLAAGAGWYFTHGADVAIAAAHGDGALVRAAEEHAWRGMFLSVVYPGLLFFAGTFFLSESPRWLFRKKRFAEALKSLRRSCSEEEAELQMKEMETVVRPEREGNPAAESLLKRKYVVPFVLACVILGCNQATGINSILSYLAVILKQAGMNAAHATQGDFAVKALNCLMTVVAVTLVDKRGRKFLLVLGTSGIIVALGLAAVVFRSFEAKKQDVVSQIVTQVQANAVHMPVVSTDGQPVVLSVLYSYGNGGERSATVLSTDPTPVLDITPAGETGPLIIKTAKRGDVPPERTGWLIAGCLALFIAAFAVGPGVVVWLALSELMPTRIRSNGMGIALLINQGVSTVIAGVFLPVTSHYGYAAMFGFWAICTVVYFVTAVWFLPETKGKTLEEIELEFAGGPRKVS
jgi:sugar porter (SP) family MFS transporter